METHGGDVLVAAVQERIMRDLLLHCNISLADSVGCIAQIADFTGGC
ncbi:MAG: hypothetical protein O2979_08785 [Proteobacteria bacterium]|nr:hypothetical protein [Pseudomonadota bacterium]